MAPDLNRHIFIRDFRIQVSIGIHDFEKDGPQTVVVNIDLLLGPTAAAHGDRIASDSSPDRYGWNMLHFLGPGQRRSRRTADQHPGSK